MWLDSIFLEVEIPAKLCFIKALVVLSLFLGGTRPLTSGKKKCEIASYEKAAEWKILVSL